MAPILQPECRHHIVRTAKGPVDVLESGSGWPILYFHGTGAGNDVVPMMEHALVHDGFRLIVPNRPGYYGTPLSCGRTPDACADLAADVLDRLSVDRAAVCGTSGGGLAASAFASRHPRRTSSLLLQCAMSHPFTSPRWMPRRLTWLFPLFRYHRLFLPILRFGFRQEMRKLKHDPSHLLQAMTGSRHAEICNDPSALQLAELIRESELRCAVQPAGIENDWANAVGKPWLEPDLIHCPTLVLHDQADPLVPYIHAQFALRCIASAKHAALHAGGHLIWVGQDGARMRQERTAFLRLHDRASISGGNP